MTSFDPDDPHFEDHPWDPFYDGGPGDMCDPAEFPAAPEGESDDD